jgi:hypothetical protein
LCEVSILFVELTGQILIFILLYLVKTPSLEHQVLRCHEVKVLSSCLSIEKVGGFLVAVMQLKIDTPKVFSDFNFILLT